MRRLALGALAAIVASVLGVGTAAGDAPSLQARCVTAGVAPLPLLTGRAFIVTRGGFSNPRLIVRWRSGPFPTGCEGRFQRSVAVEARLRPAYGGAFPIGQSGGEVDWQIFADGFKQESPRRALARGVIFGGPLGCIERVSGLVRYRVTDASGHLLRQRFGPFEPRYHHCRDHRPPILPGL
jgi:hypothetical protein